MIPRPPHCQLTNTTSSKPEEEEEEEEEETRNFYNISQRRVYKDIKISLPYNMYCRGSSHGWIITSGNEDTGYSVELLNPLQLPPLTTFPVEKDVDQLSGYDYLEKTVLSANQISPTKNAKQDYVVMAIYGSYYKLALWKPGDEVWTDIEFNWGSALDDVIYHNHHGLFYAVNSHGYVMVCDTGGGVGADHDQRPPPRPLTKVRRFAPKPLPSHSGAHKRYIVESGKDLLLVYRGETRFEVFKHLEEHKEEEGQWWSGPWDRMTTLPGRILFVGDNASLSLPVSDFPAGGVKSSCIYFTDTEDEVENNPDDYRNMGIYNLEDRTIEKIEPMWGGANNYIFPANPIWVEPTLRCCLRF